MAKVGGAYPNLLGGVSEAPAKYRQLSQHAAQDNFISDPVRGLVRRHGSVAKLERKLTSNMFQSTLDDLATWRSFQFRQDGKLYMVAYRTQAKLPGADPIDSGIICYNVTDNLWVPTIGPAFDPFISAGLVGYSAGVAAGNLLVFPLADVASDYTSTQEWDETNPRGDGTIWCRAGEYSTTYSLSVEFNQFSNPSSVTRRTVTFTTPASTYSGILDTTTVSASDPEYTKKVTDITSAYTNAVAAWAVSAATTITPGNIVAELIAALTLVAPTNSFVASFDGGVAVLTKGSSTTWKIKSVSVTDGGGNLGIVATDMVIQSVDSLPPRARAGSVLKVEPSDGKYFYMKCTSTSTDPAQSATWAECAGVTIKPTRLALFGELDSGFLRLSFDPSTLPRDYPAVSVSVSGDDYIPACLTNPITCAFMFQNRLVLGAGGTLCFSRTGDYTNFFPESSVAVVASDPVELSALSVTTDKLFHAVAFERNIMIFGREATYILNGQSPLTPTDVNLTVQARYEDLANCQPIQVAGSLYFAASKYGKTTIYQMLPGNYEQALVTYPTTLGLDGYISGDAIQMQGDASPGSLVLRTSNLVSGVYVYRFLEAKQGQVLGAWSRFTWHVEMGVLAGVAMVADGMIGLMARHGPDGTYIVAEAFSLDTGVSPTAYIDSQRQYQASSILGESTEAKVVITDGTYKYHGNKWTSRTAFLAARPSVAEDSTSLVTGYLTDAKVELTNPYMRDSEGNTITQGRLTVGVLKVFTEQTGSLTIRMGSFGASPTTVFTKYAQQVGGSIASSVPIADMAISVPIGRDHTEYRVQLVADGWLPLTINGIEWEGQLFSYRR